MNKIIFRLRMPRIFYSTPIDLEKKSLPERVIMLIKSSDSSEISVSNGDGTKTGQKIGTSGGKPVFSTITGQVKSIFQLNWLNNVQYNAVEIERTGDDEWEQLFTPTNDLSGTSREEILSRLESAGYPLNIFKADKIDKIIINCCEEDIMTSNVQATIIEKMDNFAAAVDLAKKLAGCEAVVAAQTAFEEKLRGAYTGGIETVNPVYPSGMEEILPQALNLQGNVSVIRADLLISMLETLKTGRPAYEKIITLVGEGNKPLKNIQVRIGTTISEILSKENIEIKDGYKIILGGAMRGLPVFSDNFPVQNDSCGLIIQEPGDITDLSPQPCLNCGECVRICPQKLQVNMLARYSEFNLFENCESLNLYDCIECGMCAYVCTSHKPLVQYMQFAKKQLSIKKASEKENSDDN